MKKIMKKKKTSFICNNCGYTSLKWMGKCPECEEWNSFDEYDETKFLENSPGFSGTPSTLQHIDEIDITMAERISSNYEEFDRIMGGGVVKGSYNLISGHPGIGKSTLMLQIALSLSLSNKVLYLSAEESLSQVKIRFKRLKNSSGEKQLFLTNENNLEKISELLEKEKFDFIFIDSIQTVFTNAVTGIPGSVSQIKECAVRFLEVSKRKNITFFVIGHVTKSGNIAGPMLLEHMVDTVLLFEGDPTLGYRVLRTSKNRFGATDEVGIFTMTSEGLNQVDNPSHFFVSDHSENLSGSALAIILEGSRPFLIEVQSLTSNSALPQPRRVVTGIESSRLAMINAVLEKRGDIFFSNFDIFVNIVGGLKLKTPASDLPVAASLISSILNIPIPYTVAFIGEIGLAGEIRQVPGIELMLKEGARLGIKKIYVPNLPSLPNVKNIEIQVLRNIYDLLDEIRAMNIFDR